MFLQPVLLAILHYWNTVGGKMAFLAAEAKTETLIDCHADMQTSCNSRHIVSENKTAADIQI